MTRHSLPPAPPLLSSAPTSGTESPCPHGTEEVPDDEKVSSPPDSVVGVSSTSIVHEWRYAGERFGIRADAEIVHHDGREWAVVLRPAPLSIVSVALDGAAKEILRLLAMRAQIRQELAKLADNWRMAGRLIDRDAQPSGYEIDLRNALERIAVLLTQPLPHETKG